MHRVYTYSRSALQDKRNGNAASGRTCIDSCVLVTILRAAEIVSQAHGILDQKDGVSAHKWLVQ